MGCPALAEHCQYFWRRHFLQAVGEAKALAHAKVIDGQHIGPAQLEHQQHFDGPAADTADGGQALDDFKIAQGMQHIANRDDATQGLGGKIPQGRDL